MQLVCQSLLWLVAKFKWGGTGHAFEKLGEKRRVGKVHLIADAGNGHVGVFERDFDASDQGIVNPLLGASAAHLLDQGAQVAWRQA